MPGVMDYYGYDQESGKLVHVHAHYQLMLGHDLTKNYHLTLEKPLLETAVRQGSFRVPSSRIRAADFRHPDGAETLAPGMSSWSGRASCHGTSGKNWPTCRVEPRTPGCATSWHATCLPSANLCGPRCLEALQPGCPSWRQRKGGPTTCGSSLRAYERKPPVVDTGLKLWRQRAVGGAQAMRSASNLASTSPAAVP